MATDGMWSVRQVLDGAADCPRGMVPRALPDAAFPLTVCEARLPMSQASADLGGRRYVRPSASPGRVAVMGDTGCRVKRDEVQHCDDPRAWPFAQVVRSVAAARPGLVLHLGDFWYRETCLAGPAACAGTGPLGDTWASWEADFFRPAAPLLAVAPWIFLRGNHEICGRGGEGWFRLLDPGPRAPADTACARFTPPYTVRLADWDLLLMDTGCAANGTHCTPQPDETVAEYARELASVRALATPGRPAWLATHVPFWAVLRPLGPDSVGTRSLQNALALEGGGRLPASVDLLAAGHAHLFEALDFGGTRPPQLVVGNSGTALDPAIAARPRGALLAGAPLERFTGFSGFGYGLVTFSRGGWRIDVRDPTGRALALCRSAARRLECTSL
ncbi:MAG: ser/threonine protein phosphatase [Gemmatimonadetes bacterium]|nr:ser/threonine protein phosphatase [Gemmatimonadota bacterium]